MGVIHVINRMVYILNYLDKVLVVYTTYYIPSRSINDRSHKILLYFVTNYYNLKSCINN